MKNNIDEFKRIKKEHKTIIKNWRMKTIEEQKQILLNKIIKEVETINKFLTFTHDDTFYLKYTECEPVVDVRKVGLKEDEDGNLVLLRDYTLKELKVFLDMLHFFWTEGVSQRQILKHRSDYE